MDYNSFKHQYCNYSVFKMLLLKLWTPILCELIATSSSSFFVKQFYSLACAFMNARIELPGSLFTTCHNSFKHQYCNYSVFKMLLLKLRIQILCKLRATVLYLLWTTTVSNTNTAIIVFLKCCFSSSGTQFYAN